MPEEPALTARQAGTPCRCPFCDTAVAAVSPICKSCGLELVRCSACGCVAAKGDSVCARCGQPL